MSEVQTNEVPNNEVPKVDSVRNIKNFKTATEVEAFYRFVNDNGLRNEAKMIVSKILTIIKPPKRKRRRKKSVPIQ